MGVLFDSDSLLLLQEIETVIPSDGPGVLMLNWLTLFNLTDADRDLIFDLYSGHIFIDDTFEVHLQRTVVMEIMLKDMGYNLDNVTFWTNGPTSDNAFENTIIRHNWLHLQEHGRMLDQHTRHKINLLDDRKLLEYENKTYKVLSLNGHSTVPREYMLKEALESIIDKYDYILIDCAPSLGLLTLNALTAADSVIIPIQCEYFALEGLGKLLNTIKSVQKIHNSSLDIEGLLLTMFDSRLRLSNQVVEEVQKHFHDMVFETIIQRNVKLSEAPSYGESIINYDATSKGANNYLRLAEEIIKKNSN